MTKVSADKSMATMVYLSLGSNLGDREAHLLDARDRLTDIGRIAAVSSFYETAPVEFIEQPWFLNCVVALETDLTPQQLMRSILRIEEIMGRQRVLKKGPRLIDIDVLLFGDITLDSPEVTVPHPAMSERRFVLEPLAEIAPALRHPVSNKTILELCDSLPSGQRVRRIENRSCPPKAQ